MERTDRTDRSLSPPHPGPGNWGRPLCALPRRKESEWFIIGADSCRENLREHSRAKLPNMLFVIASAQALPAELTGLVSHVTVNFPWGSLLESLLTGDATLLHGLESISSAIASVEVRLNGGALAEAGWTLEAGAEQVYNNLLRAGWQIEAPALMDATALRSFPAPGRNASPSGVIRAR